MRILNRLYGLYGELVAWLCSFGKDKYLHLLAGMWIASGLCILFPFVGLWSLLIVFGVALGKELVDRYFGGSISLDDIAFTLYGGLGVEVFVIIKMWF